MVICDQAIAQQFRIETHVYRQGVEEPISENLTLFNENEIFDFMLRTGKDETRFPKEVVIYLKGEQRFVLIDIDREIKTELLERDLIKIITAMQNAGIANKNQSFFFNPEFEEHFDIGSNWLTLSSDMMTYRAHGKRPQDDLLLDVYFDFMNQFARLNATDPRRMPPFARLRLNEAIKKYGFIPDQVELQLKAEALDMENSIQLRTEHVLIPKLSNTDLERIRSAKRYWLDFEDVTLGEFRDFVTSVETEK